MSVRNKYRLLVATSLLLLVVAGASPSPSTPEALADGHIAAGLGSWPTWLLVLFFITDGMILLSYIGLFFLWNAARWLYLAGLLLNSLVVIGRLVVCGGEVYFVSGAGQRLGELAMIASGAVLATSFLPTVAHEFTRRRVLSELSGG